MAINIDTETVSAELFARLSPFEKGYAVYMCGSREDQPNVPEKYQPAPDEAEEYANGASLAVVHIMDVEG